MIPAAPVLHPRCRVFPNPPGLVLRLGGHAMWLDDEARSQQVLRMLELLDGRAPESAVMAYGISKLSEGMRILRELDAAGMLVEKEAAPPAVTHEPRPTEIRAMGALDVVLLDAPRLNDLDEYNSRAWPSGRPWMPAFKLDGTLIAGPVVEPGTPGCYRCFETRWLCLSKAVLAEIVYFRWLNGGEWKRDVASGAEFAQLETLARQAAEGWAAGERRVVLMHDVDTGKVSRHPFLPHSACPVCGGGSPATDPMAWRGWREARPGPSLDEIGPSLDAVVDDRIGLVGHVSADPTTSDGSAMVSRVGLFALPSAIKVTRDTSRICAGMKATAVDAARVAAIEGLERYCGLYPRRAEVTAPYREVVDRALDPRELPLYSEAQYRREGFPFEPFDLDRRLSWMHAYSLTRDEPRLIPLSSASYGPTDDELVAESSNGVAARTSLVESAARGLLEMVERDAFMIHWLNHLSPPLVDRESLPEGFVRNTMREMEDAGYEPYAVDMTTDLGIPAFLAAATHRGGLHPALVVGAGCAFDPAEALEKAFHEAAGALRSLVAIPFALPSKPMDPSEVKTLDDHGKAYSHPEWLSRTEFLWSSTERRRLEDIRSSVPAAGSPGEQLAAAVELLARFGHETIVIDLTVPEVEPTGVKVTRTLVPGLQPIGFGRHYARLGGRRVYEAPVRMGYFDRPRTEDELYLVPHCFP